MQRNPYWPLNGPSFFLGARFGSCVFSRCTKVAVGFGSNFAARMASRRPNFPNSLRLLLLVGSHETPPGRA